MPRTISNRQTQSGHLAVWGLAVVMAAGYLVLPTIAWAQGKSKKGSAEHEKKSGKVAEVEKKGKTSTIKVTEADGETFDVTVTSKTKFVVNGKGDAGFFKHPRAFVSSNSVFTSNRQFFGKKFTIHLGNAPTAMFEPDPDNAEVYHIAGAIVDCDESSFTINTGDGMQKINFEQGADLSVAIESTEPEHAVVGSEVAVEGTTHKGKFLPINVVVTLDKPLVADEVFSASDKKPSGKKSASAAKTTRKPAKTEKGDKGDKEEMTENGDENPAGEPIKPGSDPFGVLKNNTKKKPPASKSKAKKPVDKGDTDN